MEKLDIDGWCTKEKGQSLMNIILERKPKVLVEIGVFGGKSLFYCAEAIKKLEMEEQKEKEKQTNNNQNNDEKNNENNEKNNKENNKDDNNNNISNLGRKIYGIDPYEKAATLEGWSVNNPNYQWWSSLDFVAIYNKFVKNLTLLGLHPYVVIVKKKSEDAVQDFKNNSIGFLHIDGNHGENATRDVKMWLDKVMSKGIIVFDDSDWRENQLAVKELRKHCKLIHNYIKWQIYEKP